MSIYGDDIDDWVAIAAGRAQIPAEFQRFIAAWELVVRWRRLEDPRDTTDRGLRDALRSVLPNLRVESEPDWQSAVEGLIEACPVFTMQGHEQTDESRTVAHSSDWDGVVEVLYQIRCNLMKAGKAPESGRDRNVASAGASVALVIAKRLLSRA